MWSQEIEENLKQVKQSCMEYKFLNMKAAQEKMRKHNVLMYSSIIISSFVGVLSTFNDPVAMVFVTIFSFLAGILSTIVKFGKFESKSTIHKNLFNRFSSLENLIERDLLIPRSERKPAVEYMQIVHRSFEELLRISPIILDSSYTNWIKVKIDEIRKSPRAGGVENPPSTEAAMLEYEMARLKSG